MGENGQQVSGFVGSGRFRYVFGMSGKHEYDVVIVGSGAAGLSAALRAGHLGAKVLVIEKAPIIGGTTAMSGGCIWVPNHHHQARLGVQDSADDAMNYIRAVSPAGWHNAEEPLWQAFVDEAPQMLRFVEDQTPITFNPNRDPDPYAEVKGGKAFGRNVSAGPIRAVQAGAWKDKIRRPAVNVELSYEEVVDTFFYAQPKRWTLRFAPRLFWRRLWDKRTRGNALTIGLLRGCIDAGVTIWAETAAKHLIVHEGVVTGIDVERVGDALAVAAKAVILASGGFEWNPEMMAKFFPGPVEWTASPDTNTGDGQCMAEAAGAQLDHMDQALIMGTTPVEYEGRTHHGLPAADYFLPYSMIVNKHGKRFINEKQMNVGLAFDERDPRTGEPLHLPAWRIYDGQFAAKYPHALPKKGVEGNHFRADTLAELAAQIDVNPTGLVETAARFSEFARAGVDEDFGRGATIWDRNRGGDPDHKPNPTLGTIEKAPFYAMPFKASFLATKGGARTDTKARVLKPDGTVLPGLYAAGNVTANSFGSKGVGAGTTLGPCLTWGYIAGGNAAKSLT